MLYFLMSFAISGILTGMALGHLLWAPETVSAWTWILLATGGLGLLIHAFLIRGYDV